MIVPTSLLRIYVTITFTFSVSKVDASLFGVPSSSIPSLFHPKSALSRIHQNMRGGGGGDRETEGTAPLPSSRPYLPYTLTIRDSVMIAHSFHGHPAFGPAGGMHGATFKVDVEFSSSSLHPECNWVIDIGMASDLVAGVLKKYNYKNLDEIFGEGIMTTTEFMCKTIHDGIVVKLKESYGNDGDNKYGFKGWVKVSLWESHKAWASFDGPSS